jgi:cation diffusion facilitator CzcD-associated flavoprotein CzcO
VAGDHNDSRLTLTNRVLKGAREKSVILGPATDAIDGDTDDLEVPADIIILENGYNATRFLHSLQVIGRSHESIQDEWAKRGGPQAYMGLALDNFPNFFMITGPNTYTGHCEGTSASSRTIATWVNRLITSEERDLKETLALRN